MWVPHHPVADTMQRTAYKVIYSFNLLTFPPETSNLIQIYFYLLIAMCGHINVGLP